MTYVLFGEVLSPIANDSNLKFMLNLIDIIFHPFLTLRLDLLKLVELHLILSCEDVFLFDVVLLRKFVVPESAPCHAHVSDKRKIVYFK